MSGINLNIDTPEWALPALNPDLRYIGIKGGRCSGKSHFVAESRIEDLIMNPDHRGVCVREVQRSLEFSSKQVLEDKIQKMGVGHLFKITQSEIRRVGGEGFIIFQGMRDHTAESIKSLEGFDWAWVEEAQKLSAISLRMLTPTIRKDNSQIIFTWNSNKPTDAVDSFFESKPLRSVLIHVNYTDNPWCPESMIEEAETCRAKNIELYNHVWLGGYNIKSLAQIFSDGWSVKEFDIDHTFGDPVQGLDFGFSQDPTAAVRLYLKGRDLYVSHEAGGVGIELDNTASFVKRKIPDFERYVTYADCSRPESISYLKRNGLTRILPCKKWAGSVEDGIAFIKSFNEIIIHPRCVETKKEFDEYSYKVDKNTDEVTDEIIDASNHYIDAIRYGLNKIILRGRGIDYKKLI